MFSFYFYSSLPNAEVNYFSRDAYGGGLFYLTNNISITGIRNYSLISFEAKMLPKLMILLS